MLFLLDFKAKILVLVKYISLQGFFLSSEQQIYQRKTFLAIELMMCSVARRQNIGLQGAGWLWIPTSPSCRQWTMRVLSLSGRIWIPRWKSAAFSS